MIEIKPRKQSFIIWLKKNPKRYLGRFHQTIEIKFIIYTTYNLGFNIYEIIPWVVIPSQGK